MGFVKWHEDAQKQQAEQQQLKEQAKLKAQKEAEETLDNEKSETATSKTIEPAKQTEPPAAATESIKPSAVRPAVTNEILRPQLASPVTVNSEINDTSAAAANVNIKDFENLAEDPFDNLELKTINDMQELESVLAITQVQQATNENIYSELQPPANDAGSTATEQPIYENPTDLVSDDNSIYGNISSCTPYPTVNSNNLHNTIAKAPIAAPRANKTPSAATNNLDKPVFPTAQFNVRAGKVNILETNTATTPTTSVKQEPSKPPPPVKPKPSGNKPVKQLNTANGGSTDESSSTKDTTVQSLASALSKELTANHPPGAPKGFSYTAAPVPDITKNGEDSKEVKDIEWPSLEQRSLPATPISEKPATVYPSTHVTPNSDVVVENSDRNSGDARINSSKQEQLKKVKKPGPVRPPPPVPSSESSKQMQANDKGGKKSKPKHSSNASVSNVLEQYIICIKVMCQHNTF